MIPPLTVAVHDVVRGAVRVQRVRDHDACIDHDRWTLVLYSDGEVPTEIPVYCSPGALDATLTPTPEPDDE